MNTQINWITVKRLNWMALYLVSLKKLQKLITRKKNESIQFVLVIYHLIVDYLSEIFAKILFDYHFFRRFRSIFTHHFKRVWLRVTEKKDSKKIKFKFSHLQKIKFAKNFLIFYVNFSFFLLSRLIFYLRFLN